MGTNSTGCAEWERDFDSITEQPYRPGAVMTFDLEPIKARAETATPGPWKAEGAPWRVRAVYMQAGLRHTAWPALCDCGAQPNEANAEFIAHAREDIPALIAEVERLRADIARKNAALRCAISQLGTLLCDTGTLSRDTRETIVVLTAAMAPDDVE